MNRIVKYKLTGIMPENDALNLASCLSEFNETVESATAVFNQFGLQLERYGEYEELEDLIHNRFAMSWNATVDGRFKVRISNHIVTLYGEGDDADEAAYFILNQLADLKEKLPNLLQ